MPIPAMPLHGRLGTQSFGILCTESTPTCYYRQVGRVGRVFLCAIPASRCNTREDWMERSPMPPCGASHEPPPSAVWPQAQATRRQSHGSFSRCALIADDACDACPPPVRDDDRRALFLLETGERLRSVWLIMSATRGEKEPGNKHSHAGPALLPSNPSPSAPTTWK